MLIKYRVPGNEAALAEICNVTFVNGTVYFRPICENVKGVKINNINNFQYEDILHNLCSGDKVDLTPFSSQTSYDNMFDADQRCVCASTLK